MGPNDVLQLNKPLYGMCDSGDYWGATLTDHIRNELSMKPLTGDTSLYMKHSGGNTVGILGSYVDDCLFATSREFIPVIEKTRKRFESKPVKWDNVEFLGVQIATKAEATGRTVFEINQPNHIRALEEINSKSKFATFTSNRALISWMCHSRPDI